MRIRSVTLATNVEYPLGADRFARFETFQRQARSRFAEAGLEVQTVRLATQPFPDILRDEGAAAAPTFARTLEAACHDHGIDYCSLGPVMTLDPDADLSYIEAIPEIIQMTEAAFASVLVADQRSGINLEAITRSAEIIVDIGRATPAGFGNLRLAVLANCGPGSPFFPVSYHEGTETRFAIATEAADLAVEAFSGAGSLKDAAAALTKAIERTARVIEDISEGLAADFGFTFGGIDFSLAPFPETERSIGHAIEALSGGRFGGSGTLFAVAFIKRAIDAAAFEFCGFSGVMLPVMEDQTLAERSVEGFFDLDSLLLYSTVCGTGLDTIPLPGDTRAEEISALLLDVATLSLVADKPLTARLMPIPGRKAGDATAFDFAYFANASILETSGGSSPKVFRLGDLWSP
jgi:hypothetical protein